MKLFRKIDVLTGKFIEDVLFEVHPFFVDSEGNQQLDPQYITVEPDQGFYLPRWNGESWEEGATQEYIDSLNPEPIWVEPSVEEKNRADIDYLAAMTGVDL